MALYSDFGHDDSTINMVMAIIIITINSQVLQCFDAVGWAAGRASDL